MQLNSLINFFYKSGQIGNFESILISCSFGFTDIIRPLFKLTTTISNKSEFDVKLNVPSSYQVKTRLEDHPIPMICDTRPTITFKKISKRYRRRYT